MEKRRRVENMYIPMELVEKVFLHLPLESLIRFSSVSKSWNSTIHSRDFANRYRGREMIVLKPYSVSDVALASPLSSFVSGIPMANFPLPMPELSPGSCIRASCGELWCVEFGDDGSVCLYNPSMQTCRKLPPSPTVKPSWSYIYGLGYDAVTDDYKVLRFNKDCTGNHYELYSQKSNSWRMFNDFKESIIREMNSPFTFLIATENASVKEGVFVNGLLHWILILPCGISRLFTILSFDLSTEKYGKVAWPASDTSTLDDCVELGVLRGRLCVYSDDWQCRGVMWVRDEGSWIKELVFNYSHIFPERRGYMGVKPLYSYDNNIKVFVAPRHFSKIIVYEDESIKLVENFGCNKFNCFTYVESMVKP